MTVVTRFAPSPTGFLHIGGARTALFNWLFARRHGGRFLMRIEDTDRKRSTDDAIQAIHEGIQWLGLDIDGEPISQFARAGRHREVAEEMLARGMAYRCFCSPEELTDMREKARAEGRPMRYDGRWRDRDASEAPAGVDPVIRLKAPQDGETTIEDKVQGSVTVANDQLDDMILLRSDGTPTYMLAVVVDDHDMGVTHVIRGDDHLTNTFRQAQIYRAMGWVLPIFAHVPLIHGPDGAKMSKRHGAIGVEAYAELGYLPEAMRNYLVRLGWAHGDDEIFSTEQATAWFDLEGIGKSPARFDFKKLENLNGHYMREADDARLTRLTMPRVRTALGEEAMSLESEARIGAGMEGLKARAKTLADLAESALFYARLRPLSVDEKAEKLLDASASALLGRFRGELEGNTDWRPDVLENLGRQFAEREQIGLGKLAQPLRAALTGSTTSPGIFDVLAVLGKEETLGRLDDVLATI
ncbi:MAG: glutamate--tRNA ligase [Rhodospirillales bacterium]